METWLKVRKQWFFRRSEADQWRTTISRQDYYGIPVPLEAWPLLDRIVELEERINAVRPTQTPSPRDPESQPPDSAADAG
jgi:hypothetical protein